MDELSFWKLKATYAEVELLRHQKDQITRCFDRSVEEREALVRELYQVYSPLAPEGYRFSEFDLNQRIVIYVPVDDSPITDP